MLIPTLFVGALVSVSIAACGSDDSSTTSTAASAGASDASVSFAEPMDGATTGSTLTAKVDLQGFKLAPDEVGKQAIDGEGHLHFSMDGGKYDYEKYSGANGKLAAQLGVDGKYSPSVTPEITYTGLPAGEHTLEVYLANNDHTDTGVEDSTTFTVK
jgi:hypothetical protein